MIFDLRFASVSPSLLAFQKRLMTDIQTIIITNISSMVQLLYHHHIIIIIVIIILVIIYHHHVMLCVIDLYIQYK